MRRLELAIGPLLARLGYTRPDETPVYSADELRPIYQLGDYRSAAPSPGSRYLWTKGRVNGVANTHAVLLFDPPAGGCWVHSIDWASDSGSFVLWATSNELAPPTPGVVGGGALIGRPDNREPAAPLVVRAGNALAPLGNASVLQYRPNLPSHFWWQGTQIWFTCETLAEGFSASIYYEPPLEGMRRQIL